MNEYTFLVRSSYTEKPEKDFNCNKTEHWRRECPEVTRDSTQNQQSDKMGTVFFNDINKSDSRNTNITNIYF